MFSHITTGCSNLKHASTFYDALLEPLGLQREAGNTDDQQGFACWVNPEKSLARFFVVLPLNGDKASAGNGSMVAFVASSASAVDDSYHAALAAGGTDEGKPGPRPQYAEGYYGAYLRDPDNNKVHIVFRGDLV